MRILGIDHATVHGGMAVLLGDTFEYLEPVYLREFEQWSPEVAMFNVVDAHIDEFKPSVVALEKPMALRNGKVARMLIEVYTSAKLAAELRDIRIIEVTPQEAKLYTAGHGQAEKEDVARALVAQFKLDIDKVAPPVYYKTGKKKGQLKERLYDVSDAAALCIAAQQLMKRDVLNGRCIS